MGTGMSIVVTVLDDRPGLAELLPALAAQRRPAQEIVIVDAGSTDGSLELVDYWRERGLPLRLMSVPGAGISAGRNRGITAAKHDRIAVTDAGCRPDPGWSAALARGLERCDFVAGTYTVDHATPFEHAVAVTLYPDVSELSGELSLPARAWLSLFGRRFRIDRATGRSMAFRRSCWEHAGGFPENVDWGEDVAFSAAAVYADAYSTIAPDAVVAWRGRRTWRENAHMYWRYAEGEAMLAVQPRAVARGLAWGFAALLALCGGRRGRLALCAGAGIYSSLPIVRAYRTGLAVRHWWRILAVVAMKDLAMLGGTFAGVRQRRSTAS
jgi:glycosyltransferase involved in cell wall biosynthesis